MEANPRRRHEQARELLRDEVREAVGGRAAELAEQEGALDAAIDADRSKTVVGALSESRALIAITVAVAVIVGAVIALITGAWWWILVALALHAVGTVVVVGMSLRLAGQAEHADPRVAAALEERGVADPDGALNDAIDAAAAAGDRDAQAVSPRVDAAEPPAGGAPVTPLTLVLVGVDRPGVAERDREARDEGTRR